MFVSVGCSRVRKVTQKNDQLLILELLRVVTGLLVTPLKKATSLLIILLFLSTHPDSYTQKHKQYNLRHAIYPPSGIDCYISLQVYYWHNHQGADTNNCMYQPNLSKLSNVLKKCILTLQYDHNQYAVYQAFTTLCYWTALQIASRKKALIRL